jgi:hypothetical protein
MSQLHGSVSAVGGSAFSGCEPVVMVQYPASSVVTVEGGGDSGGGGGGGDTSP